MLPAEVDRDDVGVGSNSNGALMWVKAKQLCRLSRNDLDGALERNPARGNVCQQQREIVLRGRRSGMGLPSIGPARLFLFFQVRSVIGGDDVGSSFQQRLPDRFVVMWSDVVRKRVR